MAFNQPPAYGKDFRCERDTDYLLTTTEGIEVVRQHTLHRLLQDDILGDDGTGSLVITGWGYDVRRLLGMTERELLQQPPIISETLQRSERIETCDVTLNPVTQAGRVIDVGLNVQCVTALGPFSIVSSVNELTTL